MVHCYIRNSCFAMLQSKYLSCRWRWRHNVFPEKQRVRRSDRLDYHAYALGSYQADDKNNGAKDYITRRGREIWDQGDRLPLSASHVCMYEVNMYCGWNNKNHKHIGTPRNAVECCSRLAMQSLYARDSRMFRRKTPRFCYCSGVESCTDKCITLFSFAPSCS